MRKKIQHAIILFALAPIFILSCKKEINRQDEQQEFPSSANNSNRNNAKRITVADVNQLYTAVNDAENAGAVIILSPGTYVLNAAHPNAGRIELLADMQLQGQPGHPEQVIIDASALPGASFTPPLNFPAARTGAIRMGRGFNSVEWVTVQGNASAQALSIIETDLIWTPGISHVRVAHSIITGGRIGIDIRNVGLASSGRVLEAEISNNEITENLVQQGQGIEIQNANGASDAVIRATLNGNYVHGNKIGLRSFNNNANNTSTNNGSITIQSNDDRFEENGIGLFINAGLNQGTTTTCNGNLLLFEAHGTSIKNNQGTVPPAPETTPPCGLFVVGGYALNSNLTSNNRVDMSLWGCTIYNNHGASDILTYGAYSSSTIPAGTNNIVAINLYGVSQNASFIATPSFPVESAGTNIVTITR